MKSTSSAKENYSADWAFNFRTSHFNVYDTDSDSEEGPAVPAEKESEEAKLAKDLDISERQETAVYKPNPFSIAKINAAARTVNKVDKPATRPEPAFSRDAPKLKAPLTIVDGFKRQAQKAHSATRGRAPALKLAPRPPAPKPVHVSNQLEKPPFMTLATHSGENLGTSGRPLALNSAAFHQATRTHDPRRLVAPRPNPSASLASEDFLRKSSNHSSPVSLKKTHIRPSGAHISQPQEASLLNSLSRRPQFAYLTDNASQDRDLSQIYGALVSSKSAVLTSPSNGPAAESYSPLLYDERYDISEPAFHSGEIPDQYHASSSNLILRERRDGRTRNSQGVVSNSFPLARDGLRPSSIAHFPVKDEPMEHYGSRDFAETSGHLVSVDMRTEPLSPSPFSEEAEGSHFSWVRGTPRPFIGAYRPVKDEPTGDYSYRDPVETLPRLSPSNLASSSLHPKEEDDISTTKFPTAQRMFDRTSKNVKQPYTGLVEQGSPHHSARTRKIPIVDTKKRPRKNAYDVSVADRDEEWSTLPSRKKSKPSLTTTFKSTKPFRLPGLLMSDKSSIKSIGMSATSKLRTITYLPPPLPNAGRTETTQECNGSSTPTRRSRKLKSRSLPSDAYPSPSRTMSSPLSRNISSPRRKMADDDDDVYHPLSPPTSDLPVPEDEMDFRLNMNSGDIRRRYPGIRAFINE